MIEYGKSIKLINAFKAIAAIINDSPETAKNAISIADAVDDVEFKASAESVLQFLETVSINSNNTTAIRVSDNDSKYSSDDSSDDSIILRMMEENTTINEPGPDGFISPRLPLKDSNKEMDLKMRFNFLVNREGRIFYNGIIYDKYAFDYSGNAVVYLGSKKECYRVDEIIFCTFMEKHEGIRMLEKYRAHHYILKHKDHNKSNCAFSNLEFEKVGSGENAQWDNCDIEKICGIIARCNKKYSDIWEALHYEAKLHDLSIGVLAKIVNKQMYVDISDKYFK
jgi:hypothetical protein